MSGVRVAVVGAGIGGATVALALAHRGVDVAVYERRETVPPVGSGLGLAHNGRRVLAELGLEADLVRAGAPVPRMSLLTAGGAEAARYDVGGLLGMRRADLLRILVDHLPVGVVHHGRDCVAVDGTRVRFADGSSVDADVVVAADGIHSRSAAVVATPPALRPAGTSVLRGFVDGRGLPASVREEQNAWLGTDRHLLTYPVDPAGTLNFAAFLPDLGGHADEWSFRVEPVLLRAAYDGWAPAVTAVLARATEVYRWDLADRDPFGPWTRGGLVLLGDAAHPMLPHMGQGANQAIEDAAILATMLAAVDEAAEVPACLTAYEAERRPRTERIQRQSRRNGQRFSGRAAPGDHGGGEDLSWVYAYDALAAGRAAASRSWSGA